jgi:hypothetical protein
MTGDWHKDHSLGPECYSDAEYYAWAQDNGLYVDAAGNVDYGPPEPVRDRDRVTIFGDDDIEFVESEFGTGHMGFLT